jgi:hypothetical protein
MLSVIMLNVFMPSVIMPTVMALYSELFRRSDIFFTKAFEEKLALQKTPKNG